MRIDRSRFGVVGADQASEQKRVMINSWVL
jgi:hypothetical protein